MIGRFLTGMIWGGAIGLGIGAAVSIVSPLPNPPAVSDAAPGGVAAAPGEETTGLTGTSQADAPVTGNSQAPADAPTRDTLTGLDDATQSTAAAPQTGDVASLGAPAGSADEGGVNLAGDDPVLPNPQALAPIEPQAADELSISTEPAQPPAPAPSENETAFDENQGAAGSEPSVDASSNAPEQPVNPESEPAAVSNAVAENATPDQETTPAVDEPTPAEPATPEPVKDAAAPETAVSSLGTPAVPLTERDNGVKVNRLTTGTDETATEVAQSAESTPQIAVSDAPPIESFAQTFDNPEGKPLMGIVLIDDGTSPATGAAGINALKGFPYPLSFAVDAAMPDAAERMRLFRQEGFEVLALVDLPQGAAPSDAETSFGAILSQMNEVVAVLEGTKTGLQGSRGLTDQVADILSQTGHGLVTQDKGLNTAPKLARKKGVPADPIFRDFDSKGQSAVVIRRFLDQAAFKAGQEGAVIMLGRLQANTITALMLWGLQDRASQVALAPISAVLQREDVSN